MRFANGWRLLRLLLANGKNSSLRKGEARCPCAPFLAPARGLAHPESTISRLFLFSQKAGILDFARAFAMPTAIPSRVMNSFSGSRARASPGLSVEREGSGDAEAHWSRRELSPSSSGWAGCGGRWRGFFCERTEIAAAKEALGFASAALLARPSLLR